MSSHSMATSTTGCSAAAAAAAAALSSPSPPLVPDRAGCSHRQAETPACLRSGSPAMASVSDAAAAARDPTDTTVAQTDVVYTPATTASSSRSPSSADEPERPARDHPSDRSNTVWSDWWMAEELAAQVGSLSKELAGLKDMMSHQRTREDGSVEGSDDVSRLKSNHRSSLASLADSHRTEIANMSAAHREELLKLEMVHIAELKRLRRGHGVDHVLVRGLHDSYQKQIENLILDLNEAKEESRELKIKTAMLTGSAAARRLSLAETVPPPVTETPPRTLGISITFDDLDSAFSVVDFWIPHPGRSFRELFRSLCFAVTNHLKTLSTATEFFNSDKGFSEASKIRRWYRCAAEDRFHFKFFPPENTDACSMKETWEDDLWKIDNFILKAACINDSWENAYAAKAAEERDDETVVDCPSSADRAPVVQAAAETVPELILEPLVSMETPSEVSFNPAMTLERINETLSQLQVSREKHTALEEHTAAQIHFFDEHKENFDSPPSRKVTVETVKDEDDPFTPPTAGAMFSNEQVLSKCPLPVGVPEQTPMEVWAQELPPPANATTSRTTAAQSDNENRKGPKSSDSWSFDEIFSPFPSDKVERGQSLDAIDEDEGENKENIDTRRPNSSNPFSRAGGFRDDKSESQHEDGPFKTPPTGAEDQLLNIQMKQYWEEVPKESFLERLRQEDYEEDERLRSIERRHSTFTNKQQAPEPVGRSPMSLLNIIDDPSNVAAPPPAPEPTTGQATPTCAAIPVHITAESESTGLGARLDEPFGAGDNDDSSVQAPENPFAGSARCDTPVLDTSRSVVSTTPLLADDATGRKSGLHAHFSPPAPIAPTDDEGRTRSPTPCIQLSGSPQTSADYFRQYRSFRKVDNRDSSVQPDSEHTQWEVSSENSGTSGGNYEPSSLHGRRHEECGPEGGQAFVWHRAHSGQGAFPTRSASPSRSPSRTSSGSSAADDDDDDDDQHSVGVTLSTTLYPPGYLLPHHSHYPGIIGGGNGGVVHNGGITHNPPPFRYPPGPHPGAVGPLGPQNMQQASQDELLLHLKNLQSSMNYHFNVAADGSVSANRMPPFMAGPVFAPNPPQHSMQPFMGPSTVPTAPGAPVNTAGSPIRGGAVHFNNHAVVPSMMRAPPGLPPPRPHSQMWPPEHRASFAYPGPTSPRHWGGMAMGGPAAAPAMPLHHGPPPAPADAMNGFPGPNLWVGGASTFSALPSTPGSGHPSVHSHPRSQAGAWYPGQPPPMPPQQPGYDVAAWGMQPWMVH